MCSCLSLHCCIFIRNCFFIPCFAECGRYFLLVSCSKMWKTHSNILKTRTNDAIAIHRIDFHPALTQAFNYNGLSNNYHIHARYKRNHLVEHAREFSTMPGFQKNGIRKQKRMTRSKGRCIFRLTHWLRDDINHLANSWLSNQLPEVCKIIGRRRNCWRKK